MPEKKEKNSKNKNFIWNGLRVGFWVMIGFWAISIAFNFITLEKFIANNVLYLVLSIIWMVDVFFTFIISIIHLTKYKEKGLAVTALVISSILILLFLLGILATLSKTSFPAA